MLRSPPITSMGVDERPELRAVIVVFDVRHLVDQNIIDAGPWSFDQVGIQDDLTLG